MESNDNKSDHLFKHFYFGFGELNIRISPFQHLKVFFNCPKPITAKRIDILECVNT